MGSSSFVPKSKRAAEPVKAAEEFPTLGDAGKDAKKAPAKGGAAAKKEAEKKKEDEDPCHGKQKEFFIYEMDPMRNVCICSVD